MTRHSQRQRALPIGSHRPRLESLEDRRLLAGVAVSTVDDLVNGDASSIAALVADDGGDGVSLREAILAANATPGADTITFDPAVFTGGDASLIRLTEGELEITDTLTIDASAATDVLITADALGNDILLPGTRITNVLESLRTEIDDYTHLLSDNSRVLNYSHTSGDLRLIDITLTGGALGSGLSFSSSDQLEISGSTISGNISYYDSGGGIYAPDGDVTLNSSTVSWNNALTAGGIYTIHGDVTLRDTIISHNTAAVVGGGITTATGAVLVNDSLITGNHGGLGNTIGNLNGAAGGIQTLSGTVTVNNSVISDNTTDANGSGLSTDTGTVTVYNSTISRNTNRAIVSESATVNVINSTLSENVNGVFITWSGTLNLTRSSVIENTGYLYLIFLEHGVANLTDSTVSGNSGLGITGYAGSTVNVFNSTLTNNTARYGGGVIDRIDRLVVRNSIIAGNHGASSMPDFREADSQSITYSLIGDATGTGLSGAPSNGNLTNVDPLLGPLSNNGGPTQTHALLPGSPAIDAGYSLPPFNVGEYDQRGVGYFRVADGGVGGLRRDIGAYEVQTANPILPGDHNLDGVVDAADYTVLRDALANPDPAFSQADIDTWRANYGATLPPASAELATTTEEQTTDLAFALLQAEPRQRTAAASLRTAAAITDSAPPVNTDLLLRDQTERLPSSETTDLEETNGDREGRTRRTEAEAPSPRSAWGLRDGL